VSALFAQAQGDLAARLTLAQGAVMPVAAEYSDGSWQSVVRVGDTYYRYQGQGDSLQLAGVNFEFSAAGQSVSWQNPQIAEDVNNDGEVTPNDAILLINRLADHGSQSLPNQRVLRQIQDAQQQGGPFWDVNGDSLLSPLDVLTVVNRFNESSLRRIDTGTLDINDPTTLSDIAAVEAFFGRVLRTAGDATLDGRFNSGDLVQIFQQGKYENGIPHSALWGDGDWDGDGMFTTSDLVLAFTFGQYSANAAPQ
jgi:hypothetical protein